MSEDDVTVEVEEDGATSFQEGQKPAEMGLGFNTQSGFDILPLSGFLPFFREALFFRSVYIGPYTDQ